MMAMLMCMCVFGWLQVAQRRFVQSLATYIIFTYILGDGCATNPLTHNKDMTPKSRHPHVKSHAITSSRYISRQISRYHVIALYLTRSHCLPACSLSNAETGTSRM
jgi:hypothetical protein